MLNHTRAIALLLAAFAATPTLAQNYVVEVHGIVCSFCSYGVAKKVAKLDFIDHDAYNNGVKVDIKNQMVYLGVREDATLNPAALFDAIESGGYKPVQIWSLDEDGQRAAVTP